MKITSCWYGEGHDPIPPKYIRQIPKVSRVMGTLPYETVDILWEEPEIKDLVDGVHAAGFEHEAIEPVNVYKDVKPGLPTRGKYIDVYNKTLENLAKYGVKVVVYNFTPVLDWLRIDLAYETEDGSNRLCYGHKKVEGMSPRDIVKLTAKESGGLALPGWKPERLADFDRVMGLYQGVGRDTMYADCQYFLGGIIPTAGKASIKMACHPDDSTWGLFGLPRIYRSRDDMDKIAKLYDSDNHGFCICAGSPGPNVDNDIPAVTCEFGEHGRLHAAHVHNVKHIKPKLFHKSPHPSPCGDLDTYAIIEAIYETGPGAYIHPDHGRMTWGKTGRLGYPLYDRALGAVYLAGLHEAIEKTHKGE